MHVNNLKAKLIADQFNLDLNYVNYYTALKLKGKHCIILFAYMYLTVFIDCIYCMTVFMTVTKSD